ncbi:MAG: hypothetical protein IKP95_03065 [Ruminococcus sp.]|nr:hypothetical protein [Ruminococcus sp.]
MKNKKLLALLLAAALCASGCGDGDSSSQGDNSSEAESGTVTTAVTPASETVTETAPPEETISEVADTPLYTAALNVFKARELKGDDISDQIIDLFDEAEDKADLNEYFCLAGKILTKDMFDPFDDLVTQIDGLALINKQCEVFEIVRPITVKSGEGTMRDYDGEVIALAFNCDSPESAKKLFDLTYTDDIKIEMTEYRSDERAYIETKDDYGLIRIGDTEFYGIYLVDNYVYSIRCFDDTDSFASVPLGGEYRKLVDYKAETEKLCAELGVKSPTKLSDGDIKEASKPDGNNSSKPDSKESSKPDGKESSAPDSSNSGSSSKKVEQYKEKYDFAKTLSDKLGSKIIEPSFDADQDFINEYKKGNSPSYVFVGPTEDLGVMLSSLVGGNGALVQLLPETCCVFAKPFARNDEEASDPYNVLYAYCFPFGSEDEAITFRDKLFTVIALQIKEKAKEKLISKKDTDSLMIAEEGNYAGWYRVGSDFYIVCPLTTTDENIPAAEYDTLCAALGITSPTKT